MPSLPRIDTQKLNFAMAAGLACGMALMLGRATATPSNMDASIVATSKTAEISLYGQTVIGLVMLIFCTLILLGVTRLVLQALHSAPRRHTITQLLPIQHWDMGMCS